MLGVTMVGAVDNKSEKCAGQGIRLPIAVFGLPRREDLSVLFCFLKSSNAPDISPVLGIHNNSKHFAVIDNLHHDPVYRDIGLPSRLKSLLFLAIGTSSLTDSAHACGFDRIDKPSPPSQILDEYHS